MSFLNNKEGSERFQGWHRPSGDYLTINEFAQQVGKSYTLIHNMVVTGRLRSVLVSSSVRNHYLIPAEEVKVFENSVRYVGRPRKGDLRANTGVSNG